MIGLDAVVSLAGLVIPPAVDFVKKKFLDKGADTPEATLSTLATTKPEVMPAYLQAQAGLLDAQKNFFNRDVCGTPSQKIIDIRAIIRPAGVICSALILAGMVASAVSGCEPDASMADTVAGVRLSCEAILSSWFGDRLTSK